MLAQPSLSTTYKTIAPEPGKTLLDLDRDRISEQFAETGALFFETPGTDVATFKAFTEIYGRDFMNYQGGGFRWRGLDRQSVGGEETIVTATGKTQDFPVPEHGEMYYLKYRPAIIWFYCEMPSPTGGETTICDGAAVYEALSDESKALFRDKQIKYIRPLAREDWQTTFQTDDIEAVKQLCAEQDASIAVDPETEAIKTEFVTPAVLASPDGQPIFINNILPVAMGEIVFKEKAFIRVRLEDDTPIPGSVMQDIRQAVEACTAAIAWQAGCTLMVDNTRILHGRKATPSGGEQRKILVRMAAAKN